ncbi:hypothetical protein, partial [Alkalicoccus luteus]|uniref:hypothetical protein n=1 Tax=Alkalicoccus luteus TaxID=1237094 RepID=UPI00197BE9E2
VDSPIMGIFPRCFLHYPHILSAFFQHARGVIGKTGTDSLTLTIKPFKSSFRPPSNCCEALASYSTCKSSIRYPTGCVLNEPSCFKALMSAADIRASDRGKIGGRQEGKPDHFDPESECPEILADANFFPSRVY